MVTYAQILTINFPGSEWSMVGNDYASLDWYSDTPKPTQDELNALASSTQIVLDNEVAKENRFKAYNLESDPIFFKSQRGEATKDEWLAAVAAIDARFPYQ
jgi:hypothetical protein